MTVVAQPSPDGYDVVVVGSGPAGLTVAKKLETLTNLRILILESGDEDIGVARELAKVEAEGDFAAAYYARHSQRLFGGTSNVWSGYCAVLDERPFLNDEWPIPYSEIYGHYPEAAHILNVPPAVHERPEAALDGTDGNVVYRPWYLSSPVRFGRHGDVLGGSARFGAGDWLRESTAVDVLLGHTATRLIAREGRVECLSLMRSNADAKPFHVAAGRVVLAAGTIQNARLLHLSLGKDKLPALGRYLMDHPHVYDYGHCEIDKAAAERVMAQFTAGDAPVREGAVAHGIGLSSSSANARGLGSATLELVAPRLVDALLAGRRKAALAAELILRAEVPSIASNAVGLSRAATDFLGQPRARVAMKFNLAAVENAMHALNAELVRAGVARIQFSAQKPSFVRGHRVRGRPFATGGGHLMGTTRMGTDPSRSVTDTTGRVHGFSNLYVAGASLFPAASAANPTLTIVALALRLAKHLAGRGR